MWQEFFVLFFWPDFISLAIVPDFNIPPSKAIGTAKEVFSNVLSVVAMTSFRGGGTVVFLRGTLLWFSLGKSDRQTGNQGR